MNLDEIRMKKIHFVVNSIFACKKDGTSINYERLITEVMIKFNTARRTAMDYIDVAMAHCSAKKLKIKGDMEIIFTTETYDKILIDGNLENTPEDVKKSIRGA